MEKRSGPAKQRKLNLSPREVKSIPKSSRLDVVPVEILAEILHHVTSPKDVLSVARCNKRLRATLLNPSNVMIWRHARSNCVVPDLPPPPPNLNEATYAAFIFDSGICYICGVSTKRMFFSFVIKVRLCGKPNCRQKFYRDHLVTRRRAQSKDSREFFLEQRVRQLDIPYLLDPVPLGAPWQPDTYYCCLRTDLAKALTEYEEMVAEGIPQGGYLLLHQAEIQLKNDVFEYACLLCDWCETWAQRRRDTEASNKAFARDLAKEAGWSLHDLLNNPTYHPLHRSHNRRLETTPENVVRPLMTRIDAEILSQMENKTRRLKSHAQQIRRADIAGHYDRLIERKSRSIFPPLKQFRALPIIRALQDREDASPFPSHSACSRPVKIPRVLKSELKRSQLIGGMIESDLDRWADTALRAFDAILGQPNWRRASTKLLHPCERVVARFICNPCHSTRKGHAAPESLDFRGACAHQCAGHQRKAAAKRTWSANQFVPDQKAIDVLSQALTLSELRAENRETESEINSIGARFICKSCDSPTVMDFSRLAGHCRRHDTMQVALVSADEAVALMAGHKYDAGSLALYTARKDKAKEMRQTKMFGCRHCQHEIPKSARAPSLERRFTFDALVSHAKAKHGIYSIGEEDFYRDPRVVMEIEEVGEEIQKLHQDFDELKAALAAIF